MNRFMRTILSFLFTATTLTVAVTHCTEYDCAVGNEECPDTPQEKRDKAVLSALFCVWQYHNCVQRDSQIADPIERQRALDSCTSQQYTCAYFYSGASRINWPESE